MKIYQLKNIYCASCAAKIEDGLSKLPWVKFVSVNFANSTLQIDAPVIARTDVSKAMEALGSDPAVETADIVLMIYSPMQVVNSIEVARRTRKIVW